eukprot:1221461-Prorocentrum_lima.AAC.1
MKDFFHDPHPNFKQPAGPVPEPGFHEPKNSFRPPAQQPEHHEGPEVTTEQQGQNKSWNG